MRKTTMAVATAFALIAIGGVVLVDRALFWRAEQNAMVEYASLPSLCAPAQTAYLRVMFIGDSIIAHFPMKATLPQCFIVINKGVSGESMKQISQRYNKEIASTKHDVVVIEGGINDIIKCMKKGEDERATVKRIVGCYRNTLSLAKSGGKKAVVCSVLPVTHAFLLPYSGAVPLPTAYDMARTNGMIDRVNDELLRLAREYDVQFCDLHRVVSDQNGEFQRSLAAADGYHVNVFGYKVISDMFASSLSKATTNH